MKNVLPGTSGLLTPYSKMDGLYFDDSMEPDDSIFDLKRSIEKIAEQKGVTFIKIDFETKEDYYEAMNNLRSFNNENIHVYSTSREDDLSIIVEPDADLDNQKKGESNSQEKTEKE